MTIDVRRLAERAHMHVADSPFLDRTYIPVISPRHLSAFANLVLEEAAKECDKLSDRDNKLADKYASENRWTYMKSMQSGTASHRASATAIRALKVKP